jgi:hypothetical protein
MATFPWYTVLILIVIVSCTSPKPEVTDIQKINTANDLYADLKVSSSQFSGMSASGKIAISGTEQMSMNLSAILGIKVLRAFFHDTDAKVAVDYNGTYIEESDIYTLLREKTGMVLSRPALLSLLKGAVPKGSGTIQENSKRDSGTLYHRDLDKGVEYFLIDDNGRLIQYQQKVSGQDNSISIIYSTFNQLDGVTIPGSITLKVPELNLDIELIYSNPALQIPASHKFDFDIPPSMKEIQLEGR